MVQQLLELEAKDISGILQLVLQTSFLKFSGQRSKTPICLLPEQHAIHLEPAASVVERVLRFPMALPMKQARHLWRTFSTHWWHTYWRNNTKRETKERIIIAFFSKRPPLQPSTTKILPHNPTTEVVESLWPSTDNGKILFTQLHMYCVVMVTEHGWGREIGMMVYIWEFVILKVISVAT